MKTIMIAAPSSGSGKTTITMGIIRALMLRGIEVCAFKTGPDYIDRAFLEKASGKRAGNLDMHLQGKDGLQTALAMAQGEYCVIEGAMGYFDGISNTFNNSSYDIARTLRVNTVLVYTPKGEMFTVIPKIKGMAEFQDSSIKAVIFNGVTEKQFKLLKDALERYTSIKPLGYIPRLESAELKSRHLGLVQSIEINDLEDKINSLADQVASYVNLDELLELMKDITPGMPPAVKKRNIKAAIAMDPAFSFYYTENLKLMEMACDVVYFSPLEDEAVPDCDFIYLGGGYPEVFDNELSENHSMLTSIKQFAEKGGFIYSECGGFMYLNKQISSKPMVGVFQGESEMTKGLQRFGYIDIELRESCFLGNAGDIITAHEFHKSVTSIEGKRIFSITKTQGDTTWECGYLYKNTYGGYPHVHFLGNMKVFNHILEHIERSKHK